MGEREIVREINALTIMPLPVKLPTEWYDTLLRILPLLRWSIQKDNYSEGEELTDIFLKKWNKILIRRDGNFVWLHLGGVACYEVIPNFIKSINVKIDSCDKEIKEEGGTEAIIQHWRGCIEDLKGVGDESVLEARQEILGIIDPVKWNEELGKSWSSAAERAHVNFGKIRPVIKKWVARYEDQCNLDEPFGGRLTSGGFPATGFG